MKFEKRRNISTKSICPSRRLKEGQIQSRRNDKMLLYSYYTSGNENVQLLLLLVMALSVHRRLLRLRTAAFSPYWFKSRTLSSSTTAFPSLHPWTWIVVAPYGIQQQGAMSGRLLLPHLSMPHFLSLLSTTISHSSDAILPFLAF